MKRDPRLYLWDVREAADAIKSFIDTKSFEMYANDLMMHSAVERQLEIIGEALNQLSQVAPELAARITDTPRAVALRNRLIHGYFVVDHALVWSIVNDDLPSLQATVTALLDERGFSR